jgi:anti-sigma regulatory factor (Ser/Thr protein kinase)
MRSEEADFVLESGSTMVLYTDGLVERRGEALDEGIERLLRCVTEAASGDDRDRRGNGHAGAGVRGGGTDRAGQAQADGRVRAGAGREGRGGDGDDVALAEVGSVGSEGLVDLLTRRLCDDEAATDDIALLVVGRPPPSTELRLSLPAEPERLVRVRRAVRHWLAAYRVHPDDVADLVLAVSELVTNVCLHAYPSRSPGRVVVEGDLVGDGVRVEVRDTGRWRTPRPDRGGRGMNLVRAMGMELVVDASPSGTTDPVLAAVRRDVDPAAG